MLVAMVAAVAVAVAVTVVLVAALEALLLLSALRFSSFLAGVAMATGSTPGHIALRTAFTAGNAAAGQNLCKDDHHHYCCCCNYYYPYCCYQRQKSLAQEELQNGKLLAASHA